MSKCRESFTEHYRLLWRPEHELCKDWQAAWNAAMDRAMEICRGIPASGFACECVSAIKQEVEK